MRSELAERLLSKVMEWDSENVAQKRSVIQMLAEYKYDHYQQYYPGMRFIESLALWLKQFEPQEREVALNFVMDHLVFISLEEMTHLVSISFDDFVKTILIEKVGQYLGKDPYGQMKEIVRSIHYEIIKRKCLFLGLSDGAHIDIFRRYNNSLSNEQVCLSYDISNEKTIELKNELQKDLEEIILNYSQKVNVDATFDTIVLLDDFTGSGISYLRKEGEEWKGKINKVIKEIAGNKSGVFAKKIDIIIVIYVTTQKAKNNLIDQIKKYTAEHIGWINFTFLPIMTIQGIDMESEDFSKFSKLAQKYFDCKIIDKHYRKGEHNNPYLGFDECALPLIIFHNAPNNSLPLLWFDERCNIKGLFPRVSRHKEELYESNT